MSRSESSGSSARFSRTKVGDYVRLAWKIVANDIDTRTYNEIMAGLRKLGADYPIDQALEEGLVNKNCYERPDECRYILWSYEEHLAQAGGGGTTVDEAAKARIWNCAPSISIEHVFPKSGGNSWRHKMVRPGDLREASSSSRTSGASETCCCSPFR